jgi:hypothetical protein
MIEPGQMQMKALTKPKSIDTSQNTDPEQPDQTQSDHWTWNGLKCTQMKTNADTDRLAQPEPKAGRYGGYASSAAKLLYIHY